MEQGRSTNFVTLAEASLGSAVADAATFTASYPDRAAPESGPHDAGSFLYGFFHRLVMGGTALIYPDDFTISFGTSSMTITNKTGATWPAGTKYILQLDQPGKRVWAPNADRTSQPLAATARSDTVLINLGAPDTADADGFFVSQDLTTAGVASVSTTVAAAIAAAALAGVADVPRNIVAAWTGTAVLTVTGKDQYGNTIVESSASGTSLTGVKAFKRVTGISVSANVTSLTVGTGNVLGLPVFLPSRRHVLSEIIDGALAGDMEHVYLPVQVNSTELLAPTTRRIVCPVPGRIARFSAVVESGLAATAGEVDDVHLLVNGAAVTGSTLTSFGTDDSALGTVGAYATALIPATADNAVVSRGSSIEIVPGGSFASAGTINFMVEIAPTGSGIYPSGTFVTGMTTGGGSTATTADVRGTYAPPVTPDGSIVMQLLVSLPDLGNRGAPQFTG